MNNTYNQQGVGQYPAYGQQNHTAYGSTSPYQAPKTTSPYYGQPSSPSSQPTSTPMTSSLHSSTVNAPNTGMSQSQLGSMSQFGNPTTTGKSNPPSTIPRNSSTGGMGGSSYGYTNQTNSNSQGFPSYSPTGYYPQSQNNSSFIPKNTTAVTSGYPSSTISNSSYGAPISSNTSSFQQTVPQKETQQPPQQVQKPQVLGPSLSQISLNTGGKASKLGLKSDDDDDESSDDGGIPLKTTEKSTPKKFKSPNLNLNPNQKTNKKNYVNNNNNNNSNGQNIPIKLYLEDLGEIRRFSCSNLNGIKQLRDEVGKYIKKYGNNVLQDVSNLRFTYLDDEAEWICLDSEEEWKECLRILKLRNSTKNTTDGVLKVKVKSPTSPKSTASTSASASKTTNSVDTPKKKKKSSTTGSSQEPNETKKPAAEETATKEATETADPTEKKKKKKQKNNTSKAEEKNTVSPPPLSPIEVVSKSLLEEEKSVHQYPDFYPNDQKSLETTEEYPKLHTDQSMTSHLTDFGSRSGYDMNQYNQYSQYGEINAERQGSHIPGATPAADPTSDAEFGCDICTKGIKGNRYNCQSCAEFDVCEDCFRTFTHSPQHLFHLISPSGTVLGVHCSS